MSLMSAVSRYVFHPLWELKDGRRHLHILRELERSQWLPLETLRARQSERLRQIVQYAAGHSKYYQRLFGQQDFDAGSFEMADFHRLPLLTKAIIRSSTEEMLSDEFPRRSLREHRTGGSTGVALKVYFDPDWINPRTADSLRADQWAGCFHGMKIASLWGNPPLPKTWKQRVRALLVSRFIWLDTLDFNERTVADFIERWRRGKPEILYGHSHSLYMLARYVIDHGIRDLRPRGIISTSMMLLANEREVIEKAFATPVFDQYGSEEVALIAAECERHEGLHLNIEHVYVEFLREDGTHVAPGEEGTIVITDLFNRGMPMIRYQIGDMGVPTDRRCSCGRGMPLMARVTGRVADYLKRRDGSLVAGVSLIERTLTAIPGLEQMQVVQASAEEIVVNVVRAPDFSAATEEALLTEVRSVLGPGIEIHANYVERIPQERSGKYRFAICRI